MPILFTSKGHFNKNNVSAPKNASIIKLLKNTISTYKVIFHPQKKDKPFDLSFVFFYK